VKKSRRWVTRKAAWLGLAPNATGTTALLAAILCFGGRRPAASVESVWLNISMVHSRQPMFITAVVE